MMAEGLTLEEIRRSFVFFRNEIEELERVLDAILAGHLKELGARALPAPMRRELEREVREARRRGLRLVRQLEGIASRLVASGGARTTAGREAPALAALGGA
jgi:hypothetical protein